MWRSLFTTLVVGLVVVASSGRAMAKRPVCDAPGVIALPAEGSVDVPINAGMWLIRTGELRPRAVAKRLQESFKPTTEYALFKTSSESDTTPPAAPEQLFVHARTSTATATRAPSTSLYIVGRFDRDAAWIELTISGPWGPLAIAAVPGHQRFCTTAGVALPAGDYKASVRAFDLAGNASENVPLDVHVEAWTRPVAARDTDVLDERGPIAIVIIVGGTMLLIVALALLPRRSASSPREVVPLAVAEAAITIARRRHAIGAGISSAIMGAGFVSGHPWLGLAPGIVVLAYVAQLMAEWLALRNARLDRTTAVRENGLLVLQGPWGRSMLSVSDATFADAQRAAAPTATVRRDE